MQIEFSAPWPWYVAGPAIGLTVPALLIAGNKLFGVSSSLRHTCAMCTSFISGRPEHLRYGWKETGLWNIVFVLGIAIGGLIAATWGSPHDVEISEQTRIALTRLGLHDLSGFAPRELFSWDALFTLKGFVAIVVGGFLVGFGTAYAGGCTSGHAISGLADMQLPSLIAVLGFFAGGLLCTHFILPLLF